jgi:GNAT superfamily N-acetyltransferase
MDLTTTLSTTAEGEDGAFVRRQLYEYNLGHTVPVQQRPLTITLHDERGRLVGGLLGGTYWGALYIEILWVAEDLRGQGCGSRLIQEAEEEARRRGCKHAHVDTIDFQAPDFYRKLGYTLWGELEDIPPGHRRIFFKKDLV